MVIEFLSLDGVMQAPGSPDEDTRGGFAHAGWAMPYFDDPFARHLNSSAKYVASRTSPKLGWENSTLIEGDLPRAVADLKQQPGGDITVLGSGDLVRTLMQHDLVDEYGLTVHPIVLGSGRRLFRDAENARRLRLVDSKPTGSGSLVLSYQPG